MNEFTEHHTTLTDKELVIIAYFEIRKFKSDARLSAKNILRKRGISKVRINNIKEEIRKMKTKFEKEKARKINERIEIVILEIRSSNNDK